MSPAWIVVVEDEPLMGQLIVDNLNHEGYGTEWITDGQSAVQRLNQGPCDLVILDIMLPGRSGLEVLAEIRNNGNLVPVLVLSALGHEQDRIRGLSLGADDYLPKPFHLRELLLRVKALLRRSQPDAVPARETKLHIGAHEIDLETYEARTVDGESYRLTQKEAMLLRYLVGNSGKVVSRHDILDTVWGLDAEPTTRTIDNFIARFRKLFEEDPRQPKHFLTLRGVGYRFEP